jgi:signal transduction histidine kinase
LQTAHHPIAIEAQTAPVLVVGDRQRLGQVFANLLSNAMKYSAEGCGITVRVRSDARSVHVDVIDGGVGIPAEHIPHLFTRFYRAEGAARRAQGLGLGLYITHRIVHAHGGSIAVVSQVDAGSTFTVTLPRHAGTDP